MLKTLKQSFEEFLFLQNVFERVLEQVILYLPKVIAGLFVFFVFYLFYKVVKFIVNKSLRKAEISESVSHLITKIMKYVFMSLAVILFADQIGIEIITLVSTLGVAGIALGLAAQQTLANFISGMIILFSKPFKENDYVELEGIYGKIKKISLRSTTMLTLDNLLVDIPNQKIVESKIINHTFNKNIRLRIAVGIAYKENIPQAQQVLLKVVEDDEQVLKYPAPKVVVSEIAESSINLELLVWIRDSHQEVPISYDLRQKVKMALDKAGIEIPFPHRQLFIESIPVEEIKQLKNVSQ